jgi:prepilin-type N-terminal cleavage/methylation domain-containing protein/prepilin-type processing-associated H-X9-DG protein
MGVMDRRQPRHLLDTGFTLPELLVTIGIIALLIGILLPALSKAKARALNLRCLSNLRSIGQNLQIYANQFQGRLPQHPSGDTWLWDVPYVTRDAMAGLTGETPAGGVPGRGRDVLYCPFFIDHDEDELWNFAPSSPGGPSAVIGYVSLIQRMPPSPLAGATLIEREFVNNYRPNVVTKNAPRKPAEIELVCDAVISQGDVFAAQGGWKGIHVTPHLDKRGQPHGGNSLYLDGHAAFVPFTAMQVRFEAVPATTATTAAAVRFWFGPPAEGATAAPTPTTPR